MKTPSYSNEEYRAGLAWSDKFERGRRNWQVSRKPRNLPVTLPMRSDSVDAAGGAQTDMRIANQDFDCVFPRGVATESKGRVLGVDGGHRRHRRVRDKACGDLQRRLSSASRSAVTTIGYCDCGYPSTRCKCEGRAKSTKDAFVLDDPQSPMMADEDTETVVAHPTQ